MVPQIIAHIDMDSFYASVEIRDDPSLTGKPVVIGSDPQNGTGRGVISTCSYEARSYGLHSGMPISQAWKLCPHAVYLRPNQKYGIVSRRIMDILREMVQDVEQVSIDEAYLDLSGCLDWAGAEARAREIKAAILARERLTCSIGIAPARSYAKIASDLHKPDGLTLLSPDLLQDFLRDLPVSHIPGIGRKSAGMLHSQGIETLRDLAQTDIQTLQDFFGSSAIKIRDIATGHDTAGLMNRGPRQSYARETTFDEDTLDLVLIRETIRELVHDLHTELLSRQVKCRTIGIRIRYTGFVTITRAVSRQHPVESEEMMMRTVFSLFEEHWSSKPVRLIGVRLSSLIYPDLAQSTLDQFIRC